MTLKLFSRRFAALHCFAFCFVASTLSVARAQDSPKPIRALMVTGGCCHDYASQKKILSEGITARANVEWVIVHEGKERTDKVSIYAEPDWAKGLMWSCITIVLVSLKMWSTSKGLLTRISMVYRQ